MMENNLAEPLHGFQNRIPGRVADELKRFPPFSMLATDVVARLAGEASVQVAVKGEFIWQQGAVPEGNLLFLARGRVEYLWQRDGQSELVDVRDVGDLLGLTALVEGVPFQVSAFAVEDCLLYTLPWPRVSALLDDHDEARNYVLRHLFWVTRVGGTVIPAGAKPVATPDGVAGRAKGILQAHLDNAQLVVSRDPARLITHSPSDTISSVAETMVRHDLESVIVTDENGLPVGIVTATDLVRDVIVGGASGDIPVESIMSDPVICVSENSSAIAATLVMMQEKISHVCVTADGTSTSPALDVWSDKELMTRSGHHPAGLLREFGRAKSLARFRELCDEVERLAGVSLTSGLSSILVGQICAELYDELVQRLLSVAISELAADGDSLPDVSWAWMSIGSDGRREQILRTDMDNALVFASSGKTAEDELNRSRFLKLTSRVVEMMVECGISRCQGGVMASNPRWCRTDAEWQAELRLDNAFPAPDDILRALVLYDMRYVAGDESLVSPLRATIFDRVPRNPAIMAKLAELTVENAPPLNFLGRFVVEKKGGREIEFDLKARGLAPLRDAARLLVLKYGLSKRYSTGSRWEELRSHVPELAEIAPLARESYEELMRIRVLNGLRRGDSGRFLEPANLTKLDRARLANVFDVLSMVQQHIRTKFRIEQRLR